MAKETSRRASLKPSEAEKGAGGLPAGATATITEAKFGTWEEAGEKALKFGRKADDPALIITCDVENVDEPMIEFLSAGKGSRLTPSDDGEYLDIAQGSSASAISDSSNTNVFITSLCDKKKQGKMALDEDDLDNGISKFLVGLEFVVGRKVVERNIDPDEGGDKGKSKPSLVAEEITKKPSGKGGSAGGGKKKPAEDDAEEEAKPKRRKPVEDDAEEEAAPKKKKPAADDDTEGFDAEAKAEELVVEALGLPKHRKGLSVDDAFGAVYALAKADDSITKPQQKQIMELMEDPKWLTSKKRDWDHEDGTLTAK
jgi:hypothetical protein